MSEPELLLERIDKVAVVTFNRPAVMNALTTNMLALMDETFAELAKDDSIRAVVLTGAGDRAFCAGGDLDDYIPKLADKGLDLLLVDPTKRFFSDFFKPIVAAVRGPCIAGGLEILQGTDIRIVGHDAKFALGEVRWGIVPAAGSHIRLPRQIPYAVAMELILTGRPIDAQRAHSIGLVNEVVEPQKVVERAVEVAATISRNGPMAVRKAREIVMRGLSLESAFALEAVMAAGVFRSEDAKEGPRSFVEKRAPVFTGR